MGKFDVRDSQALGLAEHPVRTSLVESVGPGYASAQSCTSGRRQHEQARTYQAKRSSPQPGLLARRRRYVFVRRHCEERSDEAIHGAARGEMDCFAALAMTGVRAVYSSSSASFAGPLYAMPLMTAALPNFFLKSSIARSACAERRSSMSVSSASDPSRSALTPVPIRRKAVPSISFASISRDTAKIFAASWVGA